MLDSDFDPDFDFELPDDAALQKMFAHRKAL